MTGDVISSGSPFKGVANNTNDNIIANNVVDNNKLADMPTKTLKGNDTLITDNPKDLTVSEVQTMINGDISSNLMTSSKTIVGAINEVNSDLGDHIEDIANPHAVTKTQVGLSNVENTSDLNKPISTATQTALNLKEAIANKNSPNGYCGLDVNGKIDISRIPASALERMVYVTDEVARFNLTTATAQSGDVVKQQDTGVLYFIVDDTNLSNSSGYEAFTVGTAGAVEWSNVLNKPSDIFYISTMNADSISTTTSTNKFTTQADINKLATVEENAEQNNISDINATALTNNGDTSIHFHSADRIRSNHTGTQPASTISDFNTAVASSPSVTANTAKVSFPEAPNDGSYYARKSQGWSPVLYTENTVFLENPTAPNVVSGDSSTKVANTNFVSTMLGGNTVPAKALSANGYVKMANGLIIQWGVVETAANTQNIVFPVAFNNACFNVIPSDASTVPDNSNSVARNITKTGFELLRTSVAGAVYWIAIGN